MKSLALLFALFLHATPRALGAVVINEIMINPTDPNGLWGQWLELRNTGSTAVSLQGWTIRGGINDVTNNAYVEHTFAATDSIPANYFLTIGRNNFVGVHDVVWSNMPIFNSDGSSSGTTQSYNYFTLRSPGPTTVVDSVVWNINSVMLSHRLPFPSASGISLVRTNAAATTQNPANWCASSNFINDNPIYDKASPRYANVFTCAIAAPPPTNAPTSKAPTLPPSIKFPTTIVPSRDFPTKAPLPAPIVKFPTFAPVAVPSPIVKFPTFSPIKVPSVPMPIVLPPTLSPTKVPTQTPTKQPTKQPTKTPTQAPTKQPTKQPTKTPTQTPTKAPTQAPTKEPTKQPTMTPTKEPTKSPTKQPTKNPTQSPTESPTKLPTKQPTKNPTIAPVPTKAPNGKKAPSTTSPTKAPSITASLTTTPTKAPTKPPNGKKAPPTTSPTKAPSTTSSPTKTPTKAPTKPPNGKKAPTITANPTKAPKQMQGKQP